MKRLHTSEQPNRQVAPAPRADVCSAQRTSPPFSKLRPEGYLSSISCSAFSTSAVFFFFVPEKRWNYLLLGFLHLKTSVTKYSFPPELLLQRVRATPRRGLPCDSTSSQLPSARRPVLKGESERQGALWDKKKTFPTNHFLPRRGLTWCTFSPRKPLGFPSHWWETSCVASQFFFFKMQYLETCINKQ